MGPCWRPATLKGRLGPGTHPPATPPEHRLDGGGHLQGCCEARRQGRTVRRMVPGQRESGGAEEGGPPREQG